MQRYAAPSLSAAVLLLSSISLLPATAKAAASKSLVVLSTTDVKGKTSPCGCSTPMGGLPRWAGAVDSIKAAREKVLVVVNGGFFPDSAAKEDVASFYMQALSTLAVDAVGVSEHELRYGLGFFKANLARSSLPMTCANLVETWTGKTLLAPWLVRTVAGTKVGVFGLMSEKVDPGPARDSVRVTGAASAARQAVERLRKQGATVIVLLSQLGKVESEDLAAIVPGIDVVIAGHGVPMYEKGRMINQTITTYGGEQGQYLGVTEVTLDGRGRMTAGVSTTLMLGPDIREKPAVSAMVKGFEDAFDERRRKAALRQGTP